MTKELGKQKLFKIIIKNDVEYTRFFLKHLLLKYNVDINVKDKYGFTLLIFSIELNNNIKIIKLLLENGADPNIPCKNTFTALMSAVTNNNIEVIKLLLEYNADPNLQDNYGSTVLMYAAMHNMIEIVKLLLEYNTNPNIQNNNNKTAYNIATNNKIKKLLKQ